MFQHKLFKPSILEEVMKPEGRYYKLPSGVLVPSVTTVLKAHYKRDMSGWIEWVGEEEANKIMGSSLSKGRAVHKLVEKFLLNDPSYDEGAMPFNLELFNTLRPLLEKDLRAIYGVEHTMCSNVLKTAGTADLLAEWKGEPTVIDIKTSRKLKSPKAIENYFVQAATYALMATLQYKVDFKKLAIIIAVDHDNPQVFERPVSDYVGLVSYIFMKSRSTESRETESYCQAE